MADQPLPVEAFLERAVREALAAFGLEAATTLAVRPAPGRTAFVVTLHPPPDSTIPPRRWRSVAAGVQALAEAGLAARADEGATVEVVAEGEVEPPLADEAEAPGLVAAAREVARRAVRLGRPFALGPMNAVDRRLVHQALGDLSEVWTKSEGDGMFRRLWVLPRSLVSRGGRS